jgi:hypothetical protein
MKPLKYLGYIDGKPAHELSDADRWKSYAVTTWLGIALFFVWSLAH